MAVPPTATLVTKVGDEILNKIRESLPNMTSTAGLLDLAEAYSLVVHGSGRGVQTQK